MYGMANASGLERISRMLQRCRHPLHAVQFIHWTAFMTWDCHGLFTLISLFLVFSVIFLFVPCGRLSWLPVSFFY